MSGDHLVNALSEEEEKSPKTRAILCKFRNKLGLNIMTMDSRSTEETARR